MVEQQYSATSSGISSGGAAQTDASTVDGMSDGELSDGELEHVVGGLARAWFEGVPAMTALRDYQRGAPSAIGL